MVAPQYSLHAHRCVRNPNSGHATSAKQRITFYLPDQAPLTWEVKTQPKCSLDVKESQYVCAWVVKFFNGNCAIKFILKWEEKKV